MTTTGWGLSFTAVTYLPSVSGDYSCYGRGTEYDAVLHHIREEDKQ